MNPTAHLSLLCIQPARKKWRTYTLTVRSDDKGGYEVCCTWGRLHQSRQSKRFGFDRREVLLRFTTTLLQRRLRNGYRLVERSADFSCAEWVDQFEIATDYEKQLSLF